MLRMPSIHVHTSPLPIPTRHARCCPHCSMHFKPVPQHSSRAQQRLALAAHGAQLEQGEPGAHLHLLGGGKEGRVACVQEKEEV